MVIEGLCAQQLLFWASAGCCFLFLDIVPVVGLHVAADLIVT